MRQLARIPVLHGQFGWARVEVIRGRRQPLHQPPLTRGWGHYFSSGYVELDNDPPKEVDMIRITDANGAQ